MIGRPSKPDQDASRQAEQDDHIPFRAVVLFGSTLFGVALIGVLSYLFPAGDDSVGAELLIDRNTRIFPYPFTIQNIMWLAFCMAAGELAVRHLAGRRERRQIGLRLLPEDDGTVLRRADVAAIHDRVKGSDPDGRHLLQRMLTGALLQFRNSGSIDQVTSMIELSLELYQHEIEMRYNMLRYVIWLIPTLGFIGTVLGIAFAMRTAGVMFAGASLTEATIGPRDDGAGHRRPRRGVLHDAPRPAAIRGADVRHAHHAGARGRGPQPNRSVLASESREPVARGTPGRASGLKPQARNRHGNVMDHGDGQLSPPR